MPMTSIQEGISKDKERLCNEEAKVREQKRTFDADLSALALKTYAEQINSQRLNALTNVREYGLQTVRYLFLLNGGATIALLSFIGAILSKSDAKLLEVALNFIHQVHWSFLSYAAGLVLAGLTSAAVYRNWLSVVETYQAPSMLYELIVKGETSDIPEIYGKEVGRYAFFTVTTGWSSLACFIFGTFLVVRAFGVYGV